MRRFLLLISILCITLLAAPAVRAQNTFPATEGERMRYSVQIDFGKAYLSGIGIMACVDGEVLGSVFNEFGVSALSFSYNPQKDKVKILSIIGKLNKWYIRRVIKKDMKKVIAVLKEGGTTYTNQKYHITYTFKQLEPETPSTGSGQGEKRETTESSI
jgi:hypothetical protein